MSKEKIRVLHCPSQVGGNPGTLAKYERKIGLNSWCVSEEKYYFGYRSDEVLNQGRFGLFSKEWNRLKLLRRALFDADIVHMNNGRFIYPFFGTRTHPKEEAYSAMIRKLARLYCWVMFRMEQNAYQLSGRCVFVTFQGDDARQSQCFSAEHRKSGLAVAHLQRTGLDDRSKKRKICYLQNVANRTYALNPDLIDVLPSGTTFMPYCSEAVMGSGQEAAQSSPSFVVGHAPTNRLIKGTQYVIDAVDRLRREGNDVELRLIESKDHNSALEEYRDIDVFVDQLIIGWYGVAAVELMSLGKPIICFVKGNGLRHVPSPMLDDLPIINADLHSVYEKIKYCIKIRGEKLMQIGALGVKYVKRWHHPEVIAKNMAEAYQHALAEMEVH